MKKSLFALQVFLPLEPDARLRHRLHQRVRQAPGAATSAETQRLYSALVGELTPASDRFLRGTWDYTNLGSQAQLEYDAWCKGTPNDAQERLADAQAGVARAGRRTFFVTLLVLMRRGGRADLFMEERTTMRPERLWRRDTFVRLLDAVAHLDFASVIGDSVFVCPGADELGLTDDELASELYAHLHDIV